MTTTFTEVTRVRCAPEVLFDLSLSIDAHSTPCGGRASALSPG